jgi:peptide/nickel transport system substrate-binding protein
VRGDLEEVERPVAIRRIGEGETRMRNRWLKVAVLSAAATLITVPAARAQDAGADEEILLRVGTTANLDNDNPFAVVSGSDWVVATTQYDMLLKFDSSDLGPAPSLAEGCEPSADFMTWTCTMRDGLTWSDGEPLTSEDVAFTFRLVKDNNISQFASYFPFDPVFETPDERTLIWKAEQPTFAPDMPPWVYIVPEHVWAEHYGDVNGDGKIDAADRKIIRSVPNTPSVGSGPFVLTEWQSGRSWTMSRNENYWGETPVVDEIRYQLYTNDEAMVQALKKGEIDIASDVRPSLLGSLQGQDNITVQQTISDWWLNFAFNFGGQSPKATPHPAIHDHTLREAIAMAVDKQEIVEKAYLGTAETGDTIIRPASAYWHLDIPAEEEFPYDPAAANRLLDDAGYADTDGDGVREDPKSGEPLVFDVPASQETTGAVEAGQLLVGMLREIGIEMKLHPSSEAKMTDYWYSGDFDAYIWYWSGDPDPNYQLWVFTSDQCGNWSDGCWTNPTFDRYYEEQNGTMDREARRELVFAAQREAYEDVPGLVLAYPGTIEAYRNDRFTGWVPHPGPQGYLLPTYNYDSLISLRPVGGTVAAAGSSGFSGWVWAAAGVVLVAAIAIAAGRGRRRADEEA